MFDLDILLAFYVAPQKRSVRTWMITQLDAFRERLAVSMPTQRVVFELNELCEADNLLYDYVRGNPKKIKIRSIMNAYEESGVFQAEPGKHYVNLTEVIERLELSVSEVSILLLSSLIDNDSQVRTYFPFYCVKHLKNESEAADFLCDLEEQLLENQSVWVAEVRDKLASTTFRGAKKTKFDEIKATLSEGRRIYQALGRAKNVGQAAQIFFKETEGVVSDKLKKALSDFCEYFLSDYEFIQGNKDSGSDRSVFLRSRLFLEVILSENEKAVLVSSSRTILPKRFNFFCPDSAQAREPKRCALA